MGMVTFQTLGQVAAEPGDLADTLEQRYEDLRSRCAERYGDDFCNAVLPRNLVYAVTREDRRPTIPWWAWLLMGAVVGRILR